MIGKAFATGFRRPGRMADIRNALNQNAMTLKGSALMANPGISRNTLQAFDDDAARVLQARRKMEVDAAGAFEGLGGAAYQAGRAAGTVAGPLGSAAMFIGPELALYGIWAAASSPPQTSSVDPYMVDPYLYQ